jgi:aminocarboxymuconate-semialdehyde decarboxylase
MLIDLHAHVLPGSFPAAPAGCDPASWPSMGPAAGGARELVAGPLRFTAQAAFFDAEARLAAMAASGVDAEVVSPMPPVLNYTLPPGPGRDLCRWINEFIAGLCAADPARLYGLGSVPMQDPDLAAAGLAEVRGLGLAGIEIASHVAGVSLAAAAIITGGVAEKYPGLRLAFSHGAGGLPLMLPRAQWFWGRTWNEEPASAGVAGPSPAELARRFYYDTLVFDHRAIRYLIDMIGPDRLLVGSDFPAMPREEPAGRTLRGMGLPGGVLDDIMWHNCFRFLGLPEPEGRAAGGQEASRQHMIDAPKLFSTGEQPCRHR